MLLRVFLGNAWLTNQERWEIEEKKRASILLWDTISLVDRDKLSVTMIYSITKENVIDCVKIMAVTVDTTRINSFSTYECTERNFDSPQFECTKTFLKFFIKFF